METRRISGHMKWSWAMTTLLWALFVFQGHYHDGSFIIILIIWFLVSVVFPPSLPYNPKFDKHVVPTTLQIAGYYIIGLALGIIGGTLFHILAVSQPV